MTGGSADFVVRVAGCALPAPRLVAPGAGCRERVITQCLSAFVLDVVKPCESGRSPTEGGGVVAKPAFGFCTVDEGGGEGLTPSAVEDRPEGLVSKVPENNGLYQLLTFRGGAWDSTDHRHGEVNARAHLSVPGHARHDRGIKVAGDHFTRFERRHLQRDTVPASETGSAVEILSCLFRDVLIAHSL